MTDISTTWAAKSGFSVECYLKSDSLKLIGQFCHDVIGCKTQVAFVNNITAKLTSVSNNST